MKPTLSVIIVAKNEEKNISDCLSSLSWASEIIVIDNDSTDNTAKIAQTFTNKIYKITKGTFSSRKNFASKKVSGKWLLFIDADERVTSELQKEVLSIINNKPLTINHLVFAIPRKNIILGKEMIHGGWFPDYVIRLFKKENFQGFNADLHEQPNYVGELGYLKNTLIHNKHDNLTEMVDKTNEWSEIEAKLMFDAHHPKMNLIRFGTAMFREFFLRMIKNKAYKDGAEGIIYGLYQVYSRFISYAKLWEMQNTTK